MTPTKQNLLNTKMNQLDLGNSFNRYFDLRTTSRNQKIQQEDVITLQEFFDMNQLLLFSGRGFICTKIKVHGQNSYLPVDSLMYKKLTALLIKKGFTFKDWINLLPRIENGQAGTIFDLKLLSKKQILKCSITSIAGIQVATDFFRNVVKVLEVEDIYTENFRDGFKYENKITVEKVLHITDNQLDQIFEQERSIIGIKGEKYRRIENVCMIIKKKLSDFGFTEKDGNFMKNSFGLKTKEAIIKHITKTKNMSIKRATLAYNLAKEAGLF